MRTLFDDSSSSSETISADGQSSLTDRLKNSFLPSQVELTHIPPYIKNGQEINLKLDAYNYYRFGAIKGNITYVSPSDVDRTFYCLANIKKYNPNIQLKAGYKLKGEVIIEKMKLFQYIIKKLFNKIDNSTH